MCRVRLVSEMTGPSGRVVSAARAEFHRMQRSAWLPTGALRVEQSWREDRSIFVAEADQYATCLLTDASKNNWAPIQFFLCRTTAKGVVVASTRSYLSRLN